MSDILKRLQRFAGKSRRDVSNPCITAAEAIEIANYIQMLEYGGIDLHHCAGFMTTGFAQDDYINGLCDRISALEEEVAQLRAIKVTFGRNELLEKDLREAIEWLDEDTPSDVKHRLNRSAGSLGEGD